MWKCKFFSKTKVNQNSIFVKKILKYERPFIIEHLSGVCMIEHVYNIICI